MWPGAEKETINSDVVVQSSDRKSHKHMTLHVNVTPDYFTTLKVKHEFICEVSWGANLILQQVPEDEISDG